MKDLIDKLELSLKEHGLAANTQEKYVYAVRQYFSTLKKDPRHIEPDDVRRYQVALLAKGLSSKTVNLYIAAVRFFYLQTLKMEWPERFVARAKERRKLPVILSPQEIVTLLNAVECLKAQSLITTMYSAGLRPIEVVSLKYQNIDSSRMLIHIEIAKGGKNRFVPLAESLLEMLRLYWISTSQNKWLWLFPNDKDVSQPYPKVELGKIIKTASLRAGIEKTVTARTIRHCFATHLLEMGVNLRVIQQILGHAVISSTEIYTHVRSDHLPQVKNPLDAIAPHVKWRR